jgi:hypothetical protein
MGSQALVLITHFAVEIRLIAFLKQGCEIPCSGFERHLTADVAECNTDVPRGGGVQPPKIRSFGKAGPNSQFRGIYICNNLIRIRVSLIYKKKSWVRYWNATDGFTQFLGI